MGLEGRMGCVVLALILSGCGGEPRPAARVSAPADPPSAVVLRDVAVLDVAGGAVQRSRDVLLRDGRIAAIEAAGRIDPPAGALEIDGAGRTLSPGLIDMHGHVDADPAPTWEGHFPDHEANLHGYLYAGVTTVLDPGDATPDAIPRRDAVAAGERLGPQIHTAGPIVTLPDGHPRSLVAEFAPWWIEWYLVPRVALGVETEAEARAAVDDLAGRGVDVVKIVIDAIPLDAPRMPRKIARAVVEQAASHELRVVAHIGSFEDAVDAAEAGVALWVHGVYKEPLSQAQVAQLAGYGIPMVATIEVFDRYGRASAGPRKATELERELAPAALLDSFYPAPEGFDVGGLRSWLELAAEQRGTGAANAGKLHRAGVTILAGSDAQTGVFPGAGLHRELAQLVSAGLAPMEAIRAATLDPAIFLAGGAEPDFGSVAVGKRADLLLVEGDPSRDVRALANIHTVFRGGVPLERTPVVNVD